MDSILSEYPQSEAFIDDILKVTKGFERENISTAEKFLRKLDKENLSLKLTKCSSAQKECEWLENKIWSTGVTRLNRKKK